MNNALRKNMPVSQQGFTLVEVIIAVTLLSVMVVVVFNVLHFSAKAWDKGVIRAEFANRIYLVHDLLRNAFMQAQPIVLNSKDGKTRLAFSGDEKYLRFVAPLSVAQKSGGFYVMNIERLQQNKSGVLVLKYHRYYYNDDSFEDLNSNDVELLLDNVEDVSFRYYGMDTDEQTVRWNTQWKEQSVLPYKIEMHVKFTEQDLVWPILTADPKMTKRQLMSQLNHLKAG